MCQCQYGRIITDYKLETTVNEAVDIKWDPFFGYHLMRRRKVNKSIGHLAGLQAEIWPWISRRQNRNAAYPTAKSESHMFVKC
jgi:hypothetical protein